MNTQEDRFSEVEYKEVGDNFRAYGSLLVHIATVFVAVNVLLFAALPYVMPNQPAAESTTDIAQQRFFTCVLAVLGIVVSSCTILIQFRTFRYWRQFLARGAELDDLAGFKLYRKTNRLANVRVWRSATAITFAYAVVAVFWLIVLLRLL